MSGQSENPSYKRLFSRALAAAPERLHFAAHSHHLWPDASYEGHLAAWNDAAALADRKWDKIFTDVIPQAQRHIARELHLPDPGTIAFSPNTHELLVRLISAKKADRPLDILTSDGEFHSFRRQAARWEEDGVLKRRIVACEPFESFSERFLAAMRERAPDIAFLSHVMFKSGYVFDRVEELAAFADRERTWIVLDGYHSFMAIPVDLSKVADRIFYFGGGYKYSMAGEGCAYLHAPPGFAPRPAITGWFADFGALEAKPGEIGYAPGGARFLGATFDPTGLYRFNAVRAMLDAEGLSTAAISARTDALREKLMAMIASGEAGRLREAEILAPNTTGPHARFLALRHPDATHWKLALMARDVITDARDDVLRVGFGLYHDEADVDALCIAIAATLK